MGTRIWSICSILSAVSWTYLYRNHNDSSREPTAVVIHYLKRTSFLTHPFSGLIFHMNSLDYTQQFVVHTVKMWVKYPLLTERRSCGARRESTNGVLKLLGASGEESIHRPPESHRDHWLGVWLRHYKMLLPFLHWRLSWLKMSYWRQEMGATLKTPAMAE